MGFEDILNEWELSKSSSGKNKKNINHKQIKNSKLANQKSKMSSFLDMYPPVDEIESEVIPKKVYLKQQRRNYKRMKPQKVLDLHGFTLAFAKIELDDFILNCKKRKIEKIMIIHGKGLHSPDGEAVLRIFIRNELKLSPYIGETGHPSEKEGGAGATWAIIKY